MKLLIINGPNINMLGIREKDVYGEENYDTLCKMIKEACGTCDYEIFQSNHEGDIIDKIQAAYGNTDGIVINPAAFTHTSIGILDALKAVDIPTVEVHISDINKREPFRHFSYVSLYAEKTIAGHGLKGYTEAIKYLKIKLSEKNKNDIHK